MTSKEILRWIFLLPLSFVAGLLVLFPIHWILVLKFGVDSELLEFIEQLIAPLFSAWAFVFVGATYAPYYKFRTATVLSFIWIGLSIFVSIYMLSTNSGEPRYYGLATLGGVVGALISLFQIRKNL